MRGRKLIASVGVPVAGAAVAGCAALSGNAVPPPVFVPVCGRPAGVVLVLGVHRDVPAPSLSPSLNPQVVCLVTAAIRAGKPVRIVIAAGLPMLVPVSLTSVRGGSLAQQGSPWVSHDLSLVEAAVAGVRPVSPGADDLAALAMAADAARAAGAPHAVLVLLDSGLDDRGALNFTVPGMVAAAPPEVASQLRMDGDLPVLHGLTVDLVGLGYTAAPQVPLSAKWRRNITGIWAAVVTAAGAHAEVIPEPVQGPAVRTREPVRTIPVPADTPVMPGAGRPIVLDGESPVRFEPESTVFADPAAAARALAPIASWLTVSPSRHALLVGTTADVGTMTGQIRLSRSRAARVRAQLIALGASPAQISIKGVGSDFPQFRPDRSSSGALLPGPATLNRSVRITLAAGGE